MARKKKEPLKADADNQNYMAISETIGRDARPVRKLTPPVFEEDLQTAHTPHIAFMHSICKTDFKLFKV